MKAFTEHWESKIQSYQEECRIMEKELLEHNAKAVADYRASLDESIPTKPKDSPKLISVKAQIENLVRQEEYKDAHYMQQKAFELEKEEIDKYLIERNNKIENLVDQKIQLHQNEYQSLRKRILNGLDELEIQRKNEYDRLFLKYNNLKKNIQTSQTMQSHVFDKSIKGDKLQKSILQYHVTSQKNNGNYDGLANK